MSSRSCHRGGGPAPRRSRQTSDRNAYTRVDLVMDRGEFAVRGGILDVFPPTAPHPVRIEFFGDEIDTIKEFHAPTSVPTATASRPFGPPHAVNCS